MRSIQRLLSVILILVVAVSLIGNFTANTSAAPQLSLRSAYGVAASVDQNLTQTTTLSTTSTESAQNSPTTAVSSMQTSIETSDITSQNISSSTETESTSTSSSQTSTSLTSSVVTSTETSTAVSTQTTTDTSFSDPLTVPTITLSYTSGSPGLTVQVSGSGFSATDTSCSIYGRVVASQSCSISSGTLTATGFTVANVATGLYNLRVTSTPSGNSASAQFTVSSSGTTTTTQDYSISFSPPYWLCTDVYVTFTGPLLESGYYGDTLQFQYYQYNPTLPSEQSLIFLDGPLTITSDTVTYWVHYPEYASVNFAYLPYIAVRVVDTTPKLNGNPPGLIFMQLTALNPEGAPSCSYDPSISAPEFQFQWLAILSAIGGVLVLVQNNARRKRRD